MSKINTEINYDRIYINEYDKVFQKHANKSLSELKKPTKNTLIFKRDVLLKEFNATFKEMTMKQSAPNAYLPDKYTEVLLNDFKHHLNDYVENRISNFIIDHLDNIKKSFKDAENAIPSNIKMNSKQTVEFIARYDALDKFLNRLYSIERDDTIEICEKKLNKEGYTKPANANSEENDLNLSETYSDKEQAAKFKREFTTARQVLAIKFLFQFARIKENEYDKTELAHFIRFLTGKELGNPKIQNTGIYKKTKNPYKDKDSEKISDLNYIKNYFIKLKLMNIVDLINEEIDSDK